MNLENHITPILFILGLIQGIIFSVLIVTGRNRNRSTFLLALFIFLYSINYIKPISKYLNFADTYPFLADLPLDFSWLLFALFYIYIRSVSILPTSKKAYLYLLPGILMLIINSIIYFKASIFLENIVNSKEFDFIHHIGGHLYSVFIFYQTSIFIKKHTVETNNQYSSTNEKELKWAKNFMLSGVIFTLTMHFFNLGTFETLINVGLLYWICIYGLRQQTVKNLIKKENSTPDKSKASDDKNRISEIDKDLFKNIEQIITLKKVYKNPELTIIDIANLTHEHPKKVSSVINEVSNKNFKTFINSFRIAEAKEILINNDSDNYSIEGISLEVGFKSKSAFYDAFRKETGTTPTNYKNKLS